MGGSNSIRSKKKKKKKGKIFLSPGAGQVVDVGASRARRLPCSESGSNSIRSKKKKKKKKVKIFLSPVAGQVVDVGASRARRLPCSESMSTFSPIAPRKILLHALAGSHL